MTRLYALNLNGLSLDRRGGQFDELCQVVKEVQADLICCQEPNVDASQPMVRTIMYHTARQHWPRARLSVSSTPIPFVNMYKPGGTLVLSTGNITGRLIRTEADRWGRWTSQTFRGHLDLKITVISAYQVNSDDSMKGVISASEQQRSLLLKAQDPIDDPRRAFQRDLSHYLRQCRNNGEELILVGDFNDKLSGTPNAIEELTSECGLANIMANRHQELPPPTYARGRGCLDYGFATPHVLSALTQCGYEAFNARFSTDHRSYFFDFDTALLFGSRTLTLAKQANRILQSTNVSQVTYYLKEKYDLLCNCNAFARASQLTLPGNRHQFAERLDRDMVQASLVAEKRAQKYGAPAWSVALDQARKKVSILKKCLSMCRTRLDLKNTIEQSNSTLNEPMVLPVTRREASIQLREAKRTVRELVAESYQQRDRERKNKLQQLELSGGAKAINQARILHRVQRAEEIKAMMAKIRTARTQSQRRGVTSIEIPVHPDSDPKTCTEWKVIDVPSEVVEQLQKRNREHF